MCGIAGIINFDHEYVDIDVLQAMSQSIKHRGPDDLGYFGLRGRSKVILNRDPNTLKGSRICFAHRRLSIIDLSDNAWQPMGSADGRYYIIYNGEVYNYLEIKTDLERLGFKFRSNSDTEVVLYSYIAWGKAALKKFVGMFAFAILDIENNAVFLARDQFGIKPLYYALTKTTFTFASEIKALLHVPNISRRANAQVVFNYLRFARNDYGDQTFFEAIQQLPPAHFMEILLDDISKVSSNCYWNLDLTNNIDMSFKQASITLRDMLMDNVRIHLRSDVLVGSALSGGIDSSSITACIRYLKPSAQVHTFTYVADTPDQGEKRWAFEVAKVTQSTFHTIQVSENDLTQDLQELTYWLDQPFGSTNMYGQYLVYRLAQQNGVKVILDGQGADELMAGYSYFYIDRIRSLIHQGRLDLLAGFLWKASHAQLGFSIVNLLLHCSMDILPVLLQKQLRKMVNRGIYPDWINLSWLSDHNVLFRLQNDVHKENYLRNSLYRSLMIDSLPMLLRWQDRNSMAHSVESRVPFLTPDLAQFLFSLPEDYMINSIGNRKAILRSAMEGLVPQSVLNRRDKVAFGTPMASWLNRLVPWVDQILTSEVVNQIKIFNLSCLNKCWREVKNGHRPMNDAVWRWISLIKWIELFSVNIN